MKLQSLSDRQLLQQTQQLVRKEREILSEILQHLKEMERRKLYSDLGHGSLFEYCLRELKYSEAQAGRRLQALKLIRELPQVEEQIASGALNLTHICQAQSFFKHLQKAGGQSLFRDESIGSSTDSCTGADNSSSLSASQSQGGDLGKRQGMHPSENQGMEPSQRALSKEAKLQVLNEIAHKSSREAQALLVAKTAQAGLSPQLPPERVRVLSEEYCEVRLILNQELRHRLEKVKSLLGPRALGMTLAELIGVMAELSLEALRDKKFGKRRSGARDSRARSGDMESNRTESPTAPAKPCVKSKLPPQKKKPRSISKGEKWKIWQRDEGRCGQCGSHKNLQVDHRVPVALGGRADLENLRLLCGNCNLRQGIKSFGPLLMRRSGEGKTAVKGGGNCGKIAAEVKRAKLE